MAERVYYVLIHPIRWLYWAVRHPRKLRVKCLVYYNGHFLYVRNRYLKYWTFPGKFVKRSDFETSMVESPKNEMLNLLKDELGLEIKTITHVCEFKEKYRRGRFDTVECFHAEAESAEFHVANVELWEAMWYPTEKPPAHLGMSARVVLDAIKHSKSWGANKTIGSA